MNSKLRLTATLMAIFMVVGMSSAFAQFEIGQAATPPTIDGTIDASWETLATYVGVDPTTWTPNADHKSLADCSFEWTAQWDAVNLYFLVVVKDDIATTGSQADGSSAKTWMNDNVEISITDPVGLENSVFFRFAYDRDGEDLGLLDDPPKATPVGSTFATADTDDGWLVEASIPWSILSSDTVDFSAYPAIDLMLNMNVNVADLDLVDGSGWDQLSGHVQWPWGWGKTDVTLVATATVDDTAPAAPANVASANVTYNSAYVSWDATGDADVMGFLVLANDAPKTYIADKTATSISLAGLDPETAFSISVIAIDAQNLSGETSTDFTTGSTPVPLALDVNYYTGGYATPFEDLDYMDAMTTEPFTYHYGDPNADDMDLAANMKVIWTSDALYMQVNVTDDDIQNSGAEGWQNDNVEYHFDMGGEQDGSSTEDAFDNYDPNNFQYRTVPRQAMQTGSTPAPDWTGVNMATYDYYGDGVDAIGYTIEISWPWAALNASSGLTFVPEADATISIDMKASDTDDGQADGATTTWSSFTTADQYKTDAEFGLLTLKGGTGIADHAMLDGVQLYPNPAINVASLNFESVFSGTVCLFDVTGKAVLKRNLQNVSGEMNLDVSSYSKGLYILSLENVSGKVSATKLILK